MTEPPRQLATVRTYDELIAVCRSQVAALGINYSILDEVTCFADTYSTKLLAEPAHTVAGQRPTKRHFSPASFDAFLDALCIDLVAVENPQRVKKLKGWLEKKMLQREGPIVMLPIRSIPKATWLITPKKAAKYNSMRNRKLSAKQRQAIARKAAKARWRKPQIIEIKGAEKRRIEKSCQSPGNAPSEISKPLTRINNPKQNAITTRRRNEM